MRVYSSIKPLIPTITFKDTIKFKQVREILSAKDNTEYITSLYLCISHDTVEHTINHFLILKVFF